MRTASYIAEKALKRILVQAADSGLEADETEDFYDSMNDYMSMLESRGIVLGYTTVSNPADYVTVPDGAVMGIIANMAIKVSPDYGGTVSPALILEARQGMSAMRTLGRNQISTSYPATLPSGAYNNRFYTEPVSAVLSLSGNARATEFASSNTAVRVVGFWDVAATSGLQGDINGRVTNVGAADVTVTAKVDLSATGSGTYTFRLMLNGISQHSTTSALTATPADVTVSGSVTLAPGDYTELWAEDDGGTTDAVVASAQFEVS